MRQECGGARAVLVIGALVLLALAAPAAALNVSSCVDLTNPTNNPDGETNFIVTTNIHASGRGETCLTLPRGSVLRLGGHLITGFGLDDAGSTGILASQGDAFIWGPGIVKGFETCIWAGDHVAVEDLITNQCATGIRAGHSYKIKEVRVHDCTPSKAPGIGVDLEYSEGGFIESSIVRACDIGVLTGKNNKIWNLVVSSHENVGLEVGGGTAVSRTVISSPASTSTIGLDYSECCQEAAGRTAPDGVTGVTEYEGCQDGSNSVQDHSNGLNIVLPYINIVMDGEASGRGVVCEADYEKLDEFDHSQCCVITDGHTNCAGNRVPFNDDRGIIETSC